MKNKIEKLSAQDICNLSAYLHISGTFAELQAAIVKHCEDNDIRWFQLKKILSNLS